MSQIPEVLKTKNLSVQSNMDIFTSVLEPITKSQTRVNFVLRKQGILDSGSRFVFTCSTDDADNGTAFFPQDRDPQTKPRDNARGVVGNYVGKTA